MDFNNYHLEDGFYVISPYKSDFQKEYLSVRQKENRILTNKEVTKLPDTRSDYPHFKEWQVRKQTSDRFIKYLKSKNKSLTILDVGCGNGWFSNKMAALKNIEVVGLDVNGTELQQANNCFKKNNLTFVFYDLFIHDENFENKFNIITLNASVQYFSDFEILIKKLKTFLKSNGEIHILDSPFYDKSELNSAKKRTADYFLKMAFPEMSNYYYHHSNENLKNFDIMYKPKKSILNKIFGKKQSPFMWLRLKKMK